MVSLPVPALPAGALHGRPRMTGRAEAAPRASLGYIYTLGAACIGFALFGFGLGGTLIGRTGGNPLNAFNVDIVVMFILGYAILFATRLLFWPPVPPALRACVRLVVTVIFVLEVPIALVGLVLALNLPPSTPYVTFPISFSIFTVLFQIGTVWWLLRYRREGL